MNRATKAGVETRARILNYVTRYIQKHGYAPSYEEIRVGVGLCSKSSVYTHIQKMFAIGMLETDEEYGAPRALRVPGYKFVKEGEDEHSTN